MQSEERPEALRSAAWKEVLWLEITLRAQENDKWDCSDASR